MVPVAQKLVLDSLLVVHLLVVVSQSVAVEMLLLVVVSPSVVAEMLLLVVVLPPVAAEMLLLVVVSPPVDLIFLRMTSEQVLPSVELKNYR